MDPQDTWQSMIDSLTAGDLEEAASFASLLLLWLERGGFSPKLTDLQELPEPWSSIIVNLIADHIYCVNSRAHQVDEY